MLVSDPGTIDPMRAVLISTYELGRQSFGLASAAAWLTDAGAEVSMQDLAICEFDPDPVREAGFVGIYAPMHTATRLAEQVIALVRVANPATHIACFGLYASMNADHLRRIGADSIIGGEFEPGLVEAFQRVLDGTGSPLITTDIARLPFKIPLRSGLPSLDHYARFRPTTGLERVTGYTEATRGCKHLCRHCPIVPVYGGRFIVVDPDVVLADIAAQVAAGAEHITFGDPDFFNGPAHALRVANRLHEQHPDVTYDVTIKVEHLRAHLDVLPALRDTGCRLITTAVESFDDGILGHLDKGHSADDLETVLAEVRRIGLAVNPTFVAFTPWTTLDGYLDFLTRIAELGLVDAVTPIQYAIRLLIPAGSLLLDLPDIAELVGPFDEVSLAHQWRHPDPRMDELQRRVLAIASRGDSRRATFREVWAAARAVSPDDSRPIDPPLDEAVPMATVPYLTEPWYC